MRRGLSRLKLEKNKRRPSGMKGTPTTSEETQGERQENTEELFLFDILTIEVRE